VKILAIETSTELCSAALWRDGRVDAREVMAGQRNSELLLPMIDALLGELAIAVRNLDGIAFGSGPGAFTGLRIACGVAQGMAFGLNLPVVGVGTLLALAEAAGASRVVCCLDARMGEVYHAAYEARDKEWREVHAPGLYKPSAVPRLPEGRWTGCGSGFAVHRSALETVYADSLERVMENLVPHAREIAILAARQFACGKGADAALAAPLYVRNKVALPISERSEGTLRVNER
jgi:tRNA threonylcarbamoyladenosine biosynthesis protein TsaB